MKGKSELLTISDLIFYGNQDPDHPAIESPGYQPLTYRDLRNQVIFGVKSLNAMGFFRNDRIAVMMRGGPETAVVSLAVMAGFTSAPLNPEYKKKEFETYFSKLKIKAIIVEKDCETAATAVADSFNIPVIEAAPEKDKAGIFSFSPIASRAAGDAVFAGPSDIAMLLQTSGTTSLPKIVPNSQQQLCRRAEMLCDAFKWDKTDRSIHIVPFYHALGVLGSFLAPLMAGGTVVCPKDFVASDFADLLRTYRLTHYSAGPALHQHILREIKKVPPGELKTHSLRFIRSTSAFLPDNVRSELEAVLGVPVIESYGMSEAGLVTVNSPPKPGSVGTPIVESLRILDENGKDLMPFETGEIVIQGTTVFFGYEGAPDENNAVFTNGGFKTGDTGYLDDEGYLYLTGRKKELINKGGEKISPAEIDQVLMTHPAVQQAMAFRISDTVLGEDIAAMVVVENENTGEDELRRYLLDRLIPFKVPRRIYSVDEIPKSPTGKVKRFVGTEKYTAGLLKDVKTPVLTPDTVIPDLPYNEEMLLQIWREVLNMPCVSPDDDFFRCGGNSLAAIELLIKIQRAFHVTFPSDTIYVYPTIRQQAAMIAKKIRTGAQYHPLIVPIREQGMLLPLFCFHSIGGWIGTYQNIFRFFDHDRPVFGIRARGLEPGEKPSQTIEEAVREYADAIKTVQKEGPYHLLGYSAGALYAFELACQLQSMGEPVIFLGNIDQSVPRQKVPDTVHYPISTRKARDTIMAKGFRVYRFLNNRLKTNPDGTLHTFFTKGKRAFSQRILYGASPYRDWISTYPEKQQPLIRTLRKALRNYQPPVFSGDLIFFSTGPDSKSYPGDQTRGWSKFISGKTIIVDIPGDHDNLYLDPFAQEVAQKIEASLNQVDGLG
jgi:acyl-CoA synthetase (AMP-forming)/AMP-acid ligase II/thioesterase domain-containing protein/acyl carrier protein